jgi:hypothetical protein
MAGNLAKHFVAIKLQVPAYHLIIIEKLLEYAKHFV